jgi:hypothetical protein
VQMQGPVSNPSILPLKLAQSFCGKYICDMIKLKFIHLKIHLLLLAGTSEAFMVNKQN